MISSTRWTNKNRWSQGGKDIISKTLTTNADTYTGTGVRMVEACLHQGLAEISRDTTRLFRKLRLLRTLWRGCNLRVGDTHEWPRITGLDDNLLVGNHHERSQNGIGYEVTEIPVYTLVGNQARDGSEELLVIYSSPPGKRNMDSGTRPRSTCEKSQYRYRKQFIHVRPSKQNLNRATSNCDKCIGPRTDWSARSTEKFAIWIFHSQGRSVIFVVRSCSEWVTFKDRLGSSKAVEVNGQPRPNTSFIWAKSLETRFLLQK